MTTFRSQENALAQMLICPNPKRLSTPLEPTQGFRWSSLPTPCGQRKDRHLRWRAVLRVHRSDRLEPNLIAKAGTYGLRPFCELLSRPLEAVVAMARSPRKQCRKQHVVFAI